MMRSRLFASGSALFTAAAAVAPVGCGNSVSHRSGSHQESLLGDDAATDSGIADAATGSVAVEGGIVLVNGEPFVCPGITGLSINPAALAPSQAAQLEVTTSGPAASMIAWTVLPASGGEFSDAGSPSPSFRCSDAGVVTVAVQVGMVDPSLGNVCEGVADTQQAGAIVCGGGDGG